MLARVARLYYEHDLTHQQIAEILGVSRVKVTRMLAEARRKGIVEIRVIGDSHTFRDLESQLIERFGLLDAWVVPSSSDPERLSASLGSGGAHALRGLLANGMTVGVNQSQSVASILGALGTDEPQFDAQFVPLVGSRGGTGVTNAHETSEALARAFGGHAHHLPAPVITSTSEAARVLAGEPGIAQTLDLAARADISIVGIGVPNSDSYLVREGLLTKRGVADLAAKGVAGDISARCFDAHGTPVDVPYADRIIGLTLQQHLAIPTRIALAGGEVKRPGILAAARGLLANVLVTDVETGTWLVAQP